MSLLPGPSPSFRRLAAAGVVAALVAAAAPAARADEYDSERAGHPLRIVAYVLHPIGYVFEWLVMRPAHWFVNQEPMDEVFGHDEDRLYDGKEPVREIDD